MISKDECVEKNFDGELFYLVNIKEIAGMKIYKFDNLSNTVYCTFEDGDYKKIDRDANKDLSEKIKENFENFNTDVIF